MGNMCDSLYRILLVFCLCGCVPKAWSQLLETEFIPQVSATCKSGHMNIRVNFSNSFVGTIHAKDYRTPSCMRNGDGSKSATLDVNLLAQPGAPDYCGPFINNRTEERSLSIAVRIHRTLELADDKFYVITCGKAGFLSTSLVSLRLEENGTQVMEAIFQRPYVLKVEILRPDISYGFRVKNCISYNRPNNTDQLVDQRGCPVGNIISPFVYDEKSGTAEAQIKSMFRFPESSEVHIQCDVGMCKGGCPPPSCSGDTRPLATDGGTFMAVTSVFVTNPGDPLRAPLPSLGVNKGIDGVHPSWLLWLAVALGVLFLLMLIINIFLCSVMTCACARTEIIEKEPSIIEDYDPYRSWHGSQYGSRYSLNGAPQHPKGYTSGGSTMNSTRSVSSHSDHYAIVHSRPGSRSYNKHRGPPSHIGSHFSGK